MERQHQQLPRLQNQNHQREARMRLEQLRKKSMPWRPSSPVVIDPPTLVYSITNSLGITASYYKRIARAEQLEEGHLSL